MSPKRAAALIVWMSLVTACGDDGTASGSSSATGTGGASGSSASGDGGDASSTSSPSSASGTTTTTITSGPTTTTATVTAAESVASSSASTGAGPLECSGATPSFANDVQPILTESCAVNHCHKPPNPDKSLDLSAGAAWAELVGVETVECNHGKTRVTAGDPAASYLVHKIRNEELCAGTRRMPPPNRDLLPAEQIQTIVDWICTGAPDN